MAVIRNAGFESELQKRAVFRTGQCVELQGEPVGDVRCGVGDTDLAAVACGEHDRAFVGRPARGQCLAVVPMPTRIR